MIVEGTLLRCQPWFSRILGALLVGGSVIPFPAAADGCPPPGTWLDPTQGVIPVAEAYAQTAGHQVALLGESHDDAEHHRWQLYTLAALRAREPSMVIGFEMFPRRVQSVLDQWVAGELDDEAFLEAVEWDRVWGFDPKLYLPLFHFARQNAIPMVALNVDRELIRRVGEEGWEAVPEAQREGVGSAAPASERYRRSLAEVFAVKQQMSGLDGGSHGEMVAPDEKAVAAALEHPNFRYFVEAQQTWDRAMAEALLRARQTSGAKLAVGVMGSGHVVNGHGVAYQLADLGLERVAKLLPVRQGVSCQQVVPGYVDLAFVLPSVAESKSYRPRLGVMVEAASAPPGAKVVGVVADSVAENAGLRAGDVVVAAAGEALADQAELIRVVRRQAPGTWLPLEIQRDGERLQMVARFPGRHPAP